MKQECGFLRAAGHLYARPTQVSGDLGSGRTAIVRRALFAALSLWSGLCSLDSVSLRCNPDSLRLIYFDAVLVELKRGKATSKCCSQVC